jgi:dissimilatory sulfite reductase related protein
MAKKTYAGKTIDVNDEGFMTNPNDWTKDIADEIAREEGIPSLTEAHWKIIEFCRQSAVESGKSPTLRAITTGANVTTKGLANVTTKDLFALFPKGPAKKVARISGLGKPEGCV